MKYVDEFRDPQLIRQAADEIRRLADPGRHYRIMEVCGGHTHAIYRFALEDLLPANVELIHGPGCPVCVLPMGRIDDGLSLAERPDVDLHHLRRRDAGARHATAARSSTRRAAPTSGWSTRRSTRSSWRSASPDRHVVFFAIGFETTAPSTALTLLRGAPARRRQLLRLLQPRHDHPGDPRDPRLAGHAARRLHRPRPRVHRHRLPSVRVHRPRLRQADRRLRLRAARPAAVDRDDSAPARARAAPRSRTSTRGWCRGRATCRRCACWQRCSSCGRTSSGAGSASSRSRRSSFATSTPRGTPSGASTCPASG